MRRNLNYLFQFIKSTQLLMLLCPILFHLYLMFGYEHPNAMYLMFNQFTVIISAASLLLVFFRAYIHSAAISFCIVFFSALFCLNIYFKELDIAVVSGIYLAFLLFGSIFLSLKSLITMQEIHQIEGLKKLPNYDCMEIAIISNFEDHYLNLDPYQKEFVKFKFYYKNCYAFGGNIHHNGEKYAFSNVNYYLNEQKIDINRLSADDFKLISMIFI